MAFCGNCFAEYSEGKICKHCGYDDAGQQGKYPLALHPGSILNGRYIVGRVLGQGGFGITYVALDDKSKTRIALKEYFPSELAGRTASSYTVSPHSETHRGNYEHGKELFLEEAKTLAEFIGDDNIVRIHSYFEENNTAYFAMEFVDGLALDKYMAARGGRLDIPTANKLLMPVMRSLSKIHAKGIVHRDVAPDNILINKDDVAKLIDFGAARYSTGEKSRSLDIILKHGFAPKEQYMRRGKQGPFTDVYAMAATYYYAITGKVPPEAIGRMEEDELISPSALGVKMGSRAEDVLLKALEISSTDRWQNMKDFHDAMVTAMPQHDPERLRREAEEKRLREEAERLRLEAERLAEQRRREEEAEALRKKQEAEEAERKRKEAEAEELRRRKEAEEAEKKRLREEAEAERKRKAEEAAALKAKQKAEKEAERKRKAEEAAAQKAKKEAEQKRKAEEVAVLKAKQQAEKEAERKRKAELAAEVKTQNTGTIAIEPEQQVRSSVKKKKHPLRLLLIIPVVAAVLVAVIYAAPLVMPELFGTTSVQEQGINWSFDSSTATLTISGYGPMDNYSSNSEYPPWGVHRSQIKHVVIEDGVKSVGTIAFEGFQSLESVSIPGSVESIGSAAFRECVNLEQVLMKNGLKRIETNAFNNCISLLALDIPNSVESINSNAFMDCTSLEFLTLPDKLTELGDRAFNRCASLRTVHIPGGVVQINTKVFSGCTALSELKMDYGIEEIGYEAFYGCSSLQKIEFPKSLTSINEAAFSYCSSLSEVIIPDNVSAIGARAFYNCQSLEYVELPLELRQKTFISSALYVYNGSYTNYAVFSDCINLTTVVWPERISGLDASDFVNTNLSVIDYGGSEQSWNLMDLDFNPSKVKVNYKSEEANTDDRSPQVLSGNWENQVLELDHEGEKYTWDEQNKTGVFVLNERAYGFQAITMNLTIDKLEGAVPGQWHLFAENPIGNWVHLGEFTIEENAKPGDTICETFTLNGLSFDSLALLKLSNDSPYWNLSWYCDFGVF